MTTMLSGPGPCDEATPAPVDPAAVRRRRENAALPEYPGALRVLQAHHDDGVPENDTAAAYGVYCDRWGLMALHLARRQGQVPSVQEAEHVVQDAFIKVWRLAVVPRRFDPSRSEKGLLTLTVIREASDYRQRQRPTEPLEPEREVLIQPGLVAEHSDRDRERRLVRQMFERASNQREWQPCFEMIVRRKIERATSAEIAAELGLARGTVDNYYSTARRLLQAALQAVLSEEGQFRDH